MQLIVEISEDTFFDLKKKQNRTEVDNAVIKGTPLPKGHGALKDFQKMYADMTAEEYRQRMIQAFHNANCDELIAVCVLPTKKEFEHLEWLLKTHYKKEPCEDAISRQAVISTIYDNKSDFKNNFAQGLVAESEDKE